MYDFHIFISSKPIFLPFISFLLAKTFPSLASVSSDAQHTQDTTNNTKTIERQCTDDFVFLIFINVSFSENKKRFVLSKVYRPEEWGYVNYSPAYQKQRQQHKTQEHSAVKVRFAQSKFKQIPRSRA